MKIILFSFLILSSILSYADSQDDTINLTLEIPKSLATPEAINNIALDRLNRSNQVLKTNMQKSDCADCEALAASSHSALSFTYGNGRTFAEKGEGGNQQWNFDLRLSQAIGEGCARIETGLLNEGHPVNHHRDGFYLQIGCSKKVLDNLTMELAIGGYLSMDTTTKNGIEYDEKGMNILATAALKYYIGKSGLHARLECDAVKSTNILAKHGPNSIQCLAGVGMDFSGQAKNLFTGGGDGKDLSLAAGPVWSKTNHGGTHASIGQSVDLSKVSGNWMGHVGYLASGDDGSMNDRKGVVAGVDYRIPLDDKGKNFLYTGAGIYLARNYESQKTEVNPTITFLGYEHKFGKHVYMRVDYSRVMRPNNASGAQKQGDADMVRGQIGYRM